MKRYCVAVCVAGILVTANSIASAGPILPPAASGCASGVPPIPGGGPGLFLHVAQPVSPRSQPWCAGASAFLSALYRVRSNGREGGVFRDSYSAFFPQPPDVSRRSAPSGSGGALITYDGGAAIACVSCYVTVSIGHRPLPGIQAPAVSFFDPGPWSGMDALYVAGYSRQYARSSIYTIWGVHGGPRAVPEPGTLFLFGVGLAGVLSVHRRRRSV
jgi:hypothetical protein